MHQDLHYRDFNRSTLYTITKIQYVIIVKHVHASFPAANYVYEYTAIAKLRYYPIDFLQFTNEYDYLSHVKTKDSGGIQVLFFPLDELLKSESPTAAMAALKLLGRVIVFIFSYECLPSISHLLKIIHRVKINHWYFSIQDMDELIDVRGHERYFIDHDHFFTLLSRDSKKLAKYISTHLKYLKNLRLNIPKHAFENTEYSHFRPGINNVLNIFRADNIPYINDQLKWNDAPIGNRQQILLHCLQALDLIHLEWGRENGLNPQQALATLILIFPFHNPIFRDLVSRDKKNLASKVLLASQTKDYLHFLELEDDDDRDTAKQQIKAAYHLTSEVLDGIAYLHASFQFSPVLRFPIKSSDLYKDLSLLSLGKNKGIRRSANRYKSILKLGAKLQATFLEPELENYISQRDGQILVISDLPIEWMLIQGVPLGFLCDVCRIQDSNVPGFLLNYSIASKSRFHLNEKAVEKALVIFSNNTIDREDFSPSIALANHYASDLHFNIAYARDAKDARSLIDKYKPHILIFDCHCEFDKELSRCYLQIGDDKLYSKDIVSNSLAAPIVYLCCCNTNPNYDNLDKLHDAFVAAGAISVTGTFLPLDMYRGTFMYVRMLSLLNYKQERLASGNWLHFVSFCIRTSLIWEAQGKCLNKLGRNLTLEEEQVLPSLLEKLHRFENRAEVFNQFVNEGLKISEDLTIRLEDTNLEFMYYSHYGRPDLIHFSG